MVPFASSTEYRWAGYRLDFGVTALRQQIGGHIEVEDRLLRIEIGLPLLWRLLSGAIVGRIRSEGSRLLDKPSA